MSDCMICDLYAVIDRNLAMEKLHGGTLVVNMVSELVSVLPPRGHGMHKLSLWEAYYTSPVFLRTPSIDV